MKISGVWLLGGYASLISICSIYVIADDDEWIDPFNMIDYDASSKTMKKPDEASRYSNVPTKRRGFIPDDNRVEQCPDIAQCSNKLDRLQKELDKLKMGMTISSQHPTCNPVFKRFLSKLLKEIQKLGLPTDVNADKHYDAKVKLSKQKVSEIQKLLNDEETWRTGALDDALSEILISFKLHDYEAWKWHFEDTFGVELDTVIKVSFCMLIIVLIICTEMWCSVSWFVQFKRMFAICFAISLAWNWVYLYKIEFAKHKAEVVKLENVNEKCTGMKEIDWKDNLNEWFRTTWTLQDDPCMKYYEVLIVNPILLVPPTKAITITITTFITDPLKHIGQGISEFLRALLKDLPFTLQLPVLITIVICILVFVYSSVQAAVHHAVVRPLRGGRGDAAPPAAQYPHRPLLREPEEEGRDAWARGDADRALQPRLDTGQEGNGANQMPRQGNNRPEVRRRKHSRLEEKMVYVETLRNTDTALYSGDETDTHQVDKAEESSQNKENESLTSDVAKEENEVSTHTKTEPEHSKPAPQGTNAKSHDNQAGDFGETTNVSGSSSKEENVETIGSPVQEMVL